MRIIVKAYSIFSDFIGGEVEISLDRNITVGELLEYLRGSYGMPQEPKPVVLVNGEITGLDRVLRNGDVVYIAPPFSGG